MRLFTNMDGELNSVPTNIQVSAISEDKTISTDISDIRKRYRSSESINITSPTHTNPKKKHITEFRVLQNTSHLRVDHPRDLLEDPPLDNQTGHAHACASSQTNIQNGGILPQTSIFTNLEQNTTVSQQTTSTSVSKNILNKTIDDYIDLYNDQSSFSTHLSNIEASNYEVEHTNPASTQQPPTSRPALVSKHLEHLPPPTHATPSIYTRFQPISCCHNYKFCCIFTAST